MATTGLSFLSKRSTSNGYVRKKSLENYFFGIIGHLRDPHGQSMNTWELCQHRIIGANGSACRHMGPFFWPIHHSTRIHPMKEHHRGPQLGPTNTPQASPTSQQIPIPILQLAWLLFSLIDQNPDQNAELIRLLNTSIPQAMSTI